MNHIPMEQIKELWEESNFSWDGLIKALELRGNGKGNKDYEDLILVAGEMRDSEENFPGTPDELSDIINENFPQHNHKMAVNI